jgi:hypothetical protein
MKKKGLVRLDTNYGAINLEIDCDFVPQTADNFMSLCQAKYYDGVLFHRIISGFMMQGGDPTGTGRGGESIWKKPFRDEIDSRLVRESHLRRSIRKAKLMYFLLLCRHAVSQRPWRFKYGEFWPGHEQVAVLYHIQGVHASGQEARGVWTSRRRLGRVGQD